MAVLNRITRLCDQGLDERSLRAAILDEMRPQVPFDAYAWLLTDPETSVGTAPLAELPTLGDLPETIRLKYLTAVNRWTSLGTGEAVSLLAATGGDRARSRLWADSLTRHGIDDVASTVFRDPHGCWGFLELWRSTGRFDTEEVRLLSGLAGVVTPALRRSLRPTFEAPATAAAGRRSGPAVVLLNDRLDIVSQTRQVDADLRSLLPTEADRTPVPAAVLNVAAQLLAVEADVDANPAWVRAHLGAGRWVTVAAARVEGAAAGGGSIAVTIEPTSSTDRLELYARVVGLTARETELLRRVAAGLDTRALAGELHLSQHTVQDHLKSIFAKTGAANRKALVARSTGGQGSGG